MASSGPDSYNALIERFVRRVGARPIVEKSDMRWWVSLTEQGHHMTSCDFSLKKALLVLEKSVLQHRKGRVLTAAKWRCSNCGQMKPLEVHHKVPLSKGGTHDIENLVALCHECHQIVQYRSSRSDRNRAVRADT